MDRESATGMTADVAPTSANTDAGMGLGDKIRLITGRCDPNVNLYDWYVCVRGNRVEQLWPITARGAVY